MKIISNKRYKELLDYEQKYRELTGQCITLWTGCRSRYSGLLNMSKQELVYRLLDLNNAYIQLERKYKGDTNE